MATENNTLATNLVGKLAKFDQSGAEEGKIYAAWLDGYGQLTVAFHQPGGVMSIGIIDPKLPLFFNDRVLVEPFI